MSKKVTKVQVIIAGKALSELNKLRKTLGLSTLSDIVRSSLSLVRYLQLKKEEGCEIIIRDKRTGKEKEIVFLGDYK